MNAKKDFDDFLKDNFHRCLESYKNAFGEKADDFISLAVIKVYKRIEKGGCNLDFNNYLFITLRNIIYNDTKKKKLQIADTSDSFKESFIDDADECAEDVERRRKREKAIESVFKYVEQNYSPIKSGLFKFYHKTNLTYEQISQITGFSFSYIWKVNKEIKEDLKKVYG